MHVHDPKIAAGVGGDPSRFCNGVCVDLSRDPNNCGACGHDCPTGAPCIFGTCCGLYGAACDTSSDCCANPANAPYAPAGAPVCDNGACRCCQGAEQICHGDDGICCVQPQDSFQCCTVANCEDPQASCTWACAAMGSVWSDQNPCPSSHP